MCGICGLALSGRQEVQRDVLQSMIEVMAHRGPDGDGLFLDGPVGLGHCRLSIIDLEGGRQPLANEDDSVVVVFNGEIYNYQELSKELLAAGHRFQTRSDTETLVHLYEEHGIGMLARLRGMFAFALYDRRRQVLYLARDRFGIKPLYYWQGGGKLAFASEVKPLFQAGYTVEVNRPALHLYLQTRFAHGDETIFKGVHRLPEGCYLRWKAGEVSVHRYYSPPAGGDGPPGRDYPELFRRALADAVASHMIADVPVGAYLSGGVDSSTLVSEMVRLTGHPVRTFCVDFKGGYGEGRAAEETARALGCDHHTVLCGVEELLELPAVIRTLEEPVGDGIVVAQYFLSRATRQAGIKVVLTGDGADETLGGYQYLKAIITAATWARRLPGFVFSRLGVPVARCLPVGLVDRWADVPLNVAAEAKRRFILLLRALPRRDLTELYDLLLALFCPHELRQLYTDEFYAEVRRLPREHLAGEPVGATLLDQVLSMQYRKWLPANINLKQDKLCMAHSVENRVPFLDHPFVELVAGFPGHTKINGRSNKVLLRDLARQRLRDSVSSARKVPFHLPLEHYLGDHRVWNLIEENLDERRLRRRGLLRPEYVRHLKERARGGDYMTAKKLFALVILELWHRVFVDREA